MGLLLGASIISLIELFDLILTNTLQRVVDTTRSKSQKVHPDESPAETDPHSTEDQHKTQVKQLTYVDVN